MVGIIRSEVFLFRQRKMIFVNICVHHYFPFPLHHNIMSSQNYCFPSNKHNFDRLVQWILVHLWITRRIFSFFVFCLIYPSHSVLHQALQKVKFSQSPLLSFTPCWYCGFPVLFLPIPSQIKNCKLNKPITVEHYFNFITLIICFFGSRSKKTKKQIIQ